MAGVLVWLIVVGVSTIVYHLGKARGRYEALESMRDEIRRQYHREHLAQVDKQIAHLDLDIERRRQQRERRR